MSQLPRIGAAPLCVADANLRADTLVELARMCDDADAIVARAGLDPEGAAAAAALRGVPACWAWWRSRR